MPAAQDQARPVNPALLAEIRGSRAARSRKKQLKGYLLLMRAGLNDHIECLIRDPDTDGMYVINRWESPRDSFCSRQDEESLLKKQLSEYLTEQFTEKYKQIVSTTQGVLENELQMDGLDPRVKNYIEAVHRSCEYRLENLSQIVGIAKQYSSSNADNLVDDKTLDQLKKYYFDGELYHYGELGADLRETYDPAAKRYWSVIHRILVGLFGKSEQDSSASADRDLKNITKRLRSVLLLRLDPPLRQFLHRVLHYCQAKRDGRPDQPMSKRYASIFFRPPSWEALTEQYRQLSEERADLNFEIFQQTRKLASHLVTGFDTKISKCLYSLCLHQDYLCRIDEVKNTHPSHVFEFEFHGDPQEIVKQWQKTHQAFKQAPCWRRNVLVDNCAVATEAMMFKLLGITRPSAYDHPGFYRSLGLLQAPNGVVALPAFYFAYFKAKLQGVDLPTASDAEKLRYSLLWRPLGLLAYLHMALIITWMALPLLPFTSRDTRLSEVEMSILQQWSQFALVLTLGLPLTDAVIVASIALVTAVSIVTTVLAQLALILSMPAMAVCCLVEQLKASCLPIRPEETPLLAADTACPHQVSSSTPSSNEAPPVIGEASLALTAHYSP